MAEKTEKATPKKLRDARKKGQVARSQDFPSAFTFVVSIIGTLVVAGFIYNNLSSYILHVFKSVNDNINLESHANAYFMEALQMIMITSFPIMVTVTFIGILVNFLIVGPMFSLQAMKFDLKRLNPVEGLKQKFKLKVLVELLKSILKIIGAAVIIYLAIKKMLPEVIISARLPVYGSSLILKDFLYRISIQVGIFFLAVAIFDLVFQRRTFSKEMMMEKFELKQEYKDTEGDPHIKWKRKEMFREIAYSEGASATKRAKAVIVNPTHIAVAVGYEEAVHEVPIILTMGQGPVAEKIIQIALDSHIPIMRNVALAQELFKKGKISDYIPEDTYKAVAEILKWVAALEKEEISLEIFQ